ncbi:hypothetical protein ACWCRD_02730 [Streptomyces sp. NPDC002092]
MTDQPIRQHPDELREQAETDMLVVEPYRNDQNQQRWAFRCWGTDTCDGWLGLGHHTQTSALSEQERHVAEAHGERADEDAVDREAP